MCQVGRRPGGDRYSRVDHSTIGSRIQRRERDIATGHDPCHGGRYDGAVGRGSTSPPSLRGRASSAGKGAGTNARKAGEALIEAVGRLVDTAIDSMLLTNERVVRPPGKRLLAGQADTEVLAGEIQRVVVLAVPAVRILARGARLTRVPWVMVASVAVSIGLAVRMGVRELQVVASLIAHRLEQATGAPERSGAGQEAGGRRVSPSEARAQAGRRQAAPRSAYA
jgi:hypothetical protein